MRAFRGYGLHLGFSDVNRTVLESRPQRVKAPYVKTELTEQDPEYHETRGTLWEIRGTTP